MSRLKFRQGGSFVEAVENLRRSAGIIGAIVGRKGSHAAPSPP
jgi:hypothetical protein